MKIELLYRDGSNYKFFFSVSLSEEKVAELTKKYGTLEIGTELKRDEDLGVSDEEFFDDVVGYSQSEDDHNLVDITEILDKDYITTYDI